MEKFLSILIPSNRPEGLEAFIASLYLHADDMSDIELVVLNDNNSNINDHVEYNNGIITIHYTRQTPLNVSELQYECYKVSSGKWIMLGNDDCLMKTPHWDSILREAVKTYPDEVALYYPNDNMFGDKLACFPIISRKVIEATKLFPMKYRRYKVDDTIFHMFPSNRRVYLEKIFMPHLNDEGKEGFTLESGKIYPIDRAAAEHDTTVWMQESMRRTELILKIRELIGVKAGDSDVRVVIGVPTAEFARQAVFYDGLNMLERPYGTLQCASHGQSPARGRNVIIEQAFQSGATHIMFLDDDLILPSNIIPKLLAHDKDVVTGYYLHRNYPHMPLIFEKNKENGKAVAYFPKDEDRGLQPITNCGLGCVLIKMKVFEKLEKPWITLGETEKDTWCDDIVFFNKVKKAGFEMFVDLDIRVGHMATVTITPVIINNKWHVCYETNGSGNVAFPAIRPSVEELENARKD